MFYMETYYIWSTVHSFDSQIFKNRCTLVWVKSGRLNDQRPCIDTAAHEVRRDESIERRHWYPSVLTWLATCEFWFLDLLKILILWHKWYIVPSAEGNGGSQKTSHCHSCQYSMPYNAAFITVHVIPPPRPYPPANLGKTGGPLAFGLCGGEICKHIPCTE
jgi:hypothetical protein